MYELVDSFKTYAVAVCSFLAVSLQNATEIVQSITVLLAFIAVVVRLINDIPKAKESIRKSWGKKEKSE